jgi:hypothetical protein
VLTERALALALLFGMIGALALVAIIGANLHYMDQRALNRPATPIKDERHG